MTEHIFYDFFLCKCDTDQNHASKMHLILVLIIGFVIPVLPRNTPLSLCDRPEMTQCDLQDLKIYLLTNFSLLDFSRPV